MCSILGALTHAIYMPEQRREVNNVLRHIWVQSHRRGRDGRGYISLMPTAGVDSDVDIYHLHDSKRALEAPDNSEPAMGVLTRRLNMIGNLRAEPTTEFVLRKRDLDQQPYSMGGWNIVHNGTIANDKELRTYEYPSDIDSAAIVEVLDKRAPTFQNFVDGVRKLKGSFAILASHADDPSHIYVAANYRPVWYARTHLGVFFASSRDFFPGYMRPEMLSPYSAAKFSAAGVAASESLRTPVAAHRRALVVCSGGLDSVVSATWAQREMDMDIHLIHFLYGSRAEGPEVEAVKAVAQALDCPLTLFPLNVYSKGDSPLLDPDSKVAGGEAGAEFAHEWVPARNLLLLSVATAFAEARGIDTIVLGNNLEEAGAYPDNEPEFIARFNDMLPFAVGDGKRMEVVMPVGNMMKHEIVQLGHQLGAPLDKTWSCYRAGELHCGTCGPCYMRRKAFKINGLPEVIRYADEENQ